MRGTYLKISLQPYYLHVLGYSVQSDWTKYQMMTDNQILNTLNDSHLSLRRYESSRVKLFHFLLLYPLYSGILVNMVKKTG